MGINESLALAVNASSLEWSEFKTRPIEYVAAMAGATNLASDIFRSKDHDHKAIHRAMLLLAKKARDMGIKKRLFLSPQQARLFAVAALVELLAPQCRTCNGASVIVTDALKVVCPACEGVGAHRYGNDERAKLCGIAKDKWGMWQARYEMTLGIARREDNAAAAAAFRLG